MFFIPLTQVESVELVIHALRAAGGQADCTRCPATRVCMKQCLSIAEAVQQMVQTGTLPMLGEEPVPEPPADGPPPGKGRLQVVK
jgi:hypothetical protein